MARTAGHLRSPTIWRSPRRTPQLGAAAGAAKTASAKLRLGAPRRADTAERCRGNPACCLAYRIPHGDEEGRPMVRSGFDHEILLLQGGGALGAYQAGVYEGL